MKVISSKVFFKFTLRGPEALRDDNYWQPNDFLSGPRHRKQCAPKILARIMPRAANKEIKTRSDIRHAF